MNRIVFSVPDLENKEKDRDRELRKFPNHLIGNIIAKFLINGLTHRELDKNVLNIDTPSLGFQSMNILHFLGLRKKHCGIFNDNTLHETISILESAGLEFKDIINYLKSYLSYLLSTDDNIINDIKLETDEDFYVKGKEGKEKKFLTTRYERDPSLRKTAINIHGTKCMVCGFDFNEKYGEIGEGYIEVHHRTMLSSLTNETEIDPNKDLVVVCSNCHRMIHRNRDKPLSIEELKNIIKKIVR